MSGAKHIACGCLIAVLLVIGGGAFGVKWLVDNIKPTLDPIEIQAVKESALDIDLPGDYIPTFAMYTDEGQKDPFIIYTQESQLALLSQLIIIKQSEYFTKEEAQGRMGNSFPGIESTTKLEEVASDPEVYSTTVPFQAPPLEVTFETGKTNDEGEIVDVIQTARNEFDGIIINAGGYSHTSIAIRDALDIFKGKIIELHISNIYKREEFRHKSIISGVVTGIICGLGINGYILAINSMHEMLNENK